MADLLLQMLLCLAMCAGALMTFAGAVGLVENPGFGAPFGDPTLRPFCLALGALGLLVFIVASCAYAATIGAA
ncbi:hypothetical protein ASE70_05695 [Sphingomonas sp. Leaf22]|uniref:hypothetical protein n=1 Tax=Sphingomonas sp. Leaf22 TaxID=1735687 RepID=UPI0006FC2195|nr:hypothetical protein [Sphingomonas sp. Leaf22]KQM79361.1 hypothetical protein ASE70_05695 [Sphingomonas sp. Leaf22]